MNGEIKMSTEEKTEPNNGKEEKRDKKAPSVGGSAAAAVSCGLAGVLLVLRCYQMLKITDFDTGFFTDSKSATVLPMYVSFVLFVVLTMLTVKLARLTLRKEPASERDIIHGAASVLMCAGFVCAGIDGFVSFFENVSGSGMTQLVYLKANKAYSEVLSPLLAFFSAGAVLTDAVAAFTGRSAAKKLRMLHLCPALWLFSLTVGYFGITANYLKEPQFMLLIFATVFFMLFMFEYARFVCGVAAESSEKLFVSSGAVSVGLFAAVLIPELLAGIFAEGYSGVVNADFAWWQAAAPVFALSALRMRFGCDAAPCEHSGAELSEDGEKI